eukprot:SAG31_NODE_1415_length_8443_cov_6.910986_1_plen_88_part_00
MQLLNFGAAVARFTAGDAGSSGRCHRPPANSINGNAERSFGCYHPSSTAIPKLTPPSRQSLACDGGFLRYHTMLTMVELEDGNGRSP